MKKKIPYGRQEIDDDDIKSVINVLNSDFLTQGPKIKEFEQKFASYVDSKYAVAVNNATSALHLSVMSLGLKPGDRVITTPISFVSTANCARFLGAEVWFADIDPKTFLLDLKSVEKLIESKPKNFFKGIIAVDFGGLPLDLEKFNLVAKKNDLWIVEDACHAPGGFFLDSLGKKINCGSCVYNEISVFSFHPVKHIACGEGGMITTNSKVLYEKLLMLRSHGIIKNGNHNSEGGWYYEMIDLGFNYRLTDIQSALGISQLQKNQHGIQKRNQLANIYKERLKGILSFQKIPKNSFSAYHLFLIQSSSRKNLYEYLKNNNIYTQVHYIPIHTQPYYSKIDYSEADLSNSENYYEKCLSLPMYPGLSFEDQSFVIDKIIDFFSL